MVNARFMTFEQYHGKRNIGSTRIRVRNLLKHWKEADIYKYGENPDVLIFQKVYMTGETYRSTAYKFHKYFPGTKILDICDPDWLNAGTTKGCLIKETVDNVDAVVTSTDALRDFISQLTDKPVITIADRFIVDNVPAPKQHVGDAKSVVWFGYSHNAEVLKHAVKVFERFNLSLTVISDKDPFAYRWAVSDSYQEKYTYLAYDEATIMEDLRGHDICVLPHGMRVVDRYKSNNKTIKAWLAGLPVAHDAEQLEQFLPARERNIEALARWSEAKNEYDVRKSVEEYKALIKDITNANKT